MEQAARISPYGNGNGSNVYRGTFGGKRIFVTATPEIAQPKFSAYSIPGIPREVECINAQTRSDTPRGNYRLSLDEIAKIISKHTGVSVEQIKAPCRKRKIAEARHIFNWVAYNYSQRNSLKKIGAFVSRDHSTIIHSRVLIDNFISSGIETDLIAMIASIEMEIKNTENQ